MIYLELFLAFLQIGLLSIGGGYAAMPIIEQQLVQQKSWLSVTEFADVVTIAEMTPGPIALNAASFVGTRLAGFLGAIVATIGFILPSCVIIAILIILYRKFKNLKAVNGALRGLRPAVVGMIGAAALTIIKLSFFSQSKATIGLINIASIAIFALAFLFLRKLKAKPVLVMLGCGLLGLLVYGGLELWL